MADATITKIPLNDGHPDSGGRLLLCTKVVDITSTAATTQAVGFIPANAFILGMTARITTAIAGTDISVISLGTDGNADSFIDTTDGGTYAAGTTFVCGTHSDNILPYYNAAADDLMLTQDGSAAFAGVIRVEMTYIEFTPPAA